jgi:hypothetical protein
VGGPGRRTRGWVLRRGRVFLLGPREEVELGAANGVNFADENSVEVVVSCFPFPLAVEAERDLPVFPPCESNSSHSISLLKKSSSSATTTGFPFDPAACCWLCFGGTRSDQSCQPSSSNSAISIIPTPSTSTILSRNESPLVNADINPLSIGTLSATGCARGSLLGDSSSSSKALRFGPPKSRGFCTVAGDLFGCEDGGGACARARANIAGVGAGRVWWC